MKTTLCRLVRRRLAILAACGLPVAISIPSIATATDDSTNRVESVGEETTVTVPGLDAAIKVFLPTNYVATRKWPAIFYYHAMNHTPDTAILRAFTASRDYILVGLPYLADGASQTTAAEREAALQRELSGFRASRAWVAAHTAMDERRVFLAGASKGGWMTARLGEHELSRLAGLIIMLSGRVLYAQQSALAAALPGKPIYVGAGETDANLIPALEAREYYRRNGATVTLEIFTGVGHEVPTQAARLTEWLEAHGRYGESPEPQAFEALKTSFRDRAAQIKAEQDPATKYAALADVVQNPLLALCLPASIPGITSQLAALRARLPVQQAEWQAEETFNEILWNGTKLRRLADQKAVRDDLKKLSESLPDTRYGKLAADFYVRMAAAYEKSAEATRQAEAAAPKAKPPTSTGPTSVPFAPILGHEPRPVMRQNGKKITFQ